jgi:hypothetical protein
VAFREVGVHEIKEMLRLWLRGEGLRSIARLSRVDRKTVRRYVEAARECGLSRAGDDGQLGDELLSRVAERIRPHRSGGHGDSSALLAAHQGRLEELLDQGPTVVRAGELLGREGVVVPQRTLHRHALEVLGHGRASRAATVRVADCEPGAECQVDFGRMGLLHDPVAGRRRVVRALIFTAVYSRHCYVHLTFRQDLLAVIAGCDAACVLRRGLQGHHAGICSAEHIPASVPGRVMWPVTAGTPVFRPSRARCCRHGPHNVQSDASQLRSDSSDRQTGLVRDSAEVPGGSTARRAASLVLVLISA